MHSLIASGAVNGGNHQSSSHLLDMVGHHHRGMKMEIVGGSNSNDWNEME